MRKVYILSLFLVILGMACTVDVPVVPIDQKPIEVTLNEPSIPNFGAIAPFDDNPLTVQGIELGRMLFYDPILSGDNTMSCASCHNQALGFADGKKTSVGIDGVNGTRSSMSLVNLAWDKHFFWDGRTKTLEEQALEPIQDPIELNQSMDELVNELMDSEIYPEKFKAAFEIDTITPELIGMAIAQFERTLISSNSRFDQYLRNEVEFTDEEKLGYELFATHPEPGQIRGGNCADCHLGFNFTNNDLINNGVDSIIGEDKGVELLTGMASDRGKFKVVSLRNIAVTGPYMHDGRFETLEEVLDHYNQTGIFAHENVDPLIQGGTNEPDGQSLLLSNKEKNAIVAFLKTLTDSTYLNNPDFADPF